MRYEKDREAVRQCALCIPALEGQDQSQHNRRISGTVTVGLCAFFCYILPLSFQVKGYGIILS